ncbi:sigma-70 family RNA polymerase sigma factor [Luteolibacter arcticus]|uniref:Sigma-70 family RNA polymerase sigma factor n=1 Tax=Luteolibacter arcticus TaxID=1581411 RepID=A0ABT3GN66_9BACT|nr:sigma-70 family RNA polymerase sigma factor [Luteolibacter arcticus]MCW1924958.1 sigma-70 family RNA polymerase sigma factor [Luteolibacter arcticus]
MSTGMASPFPVTQWTAVVDVCRGGSPADRQVALERLCADYWYPLYVFARRQGHPRPDAEDLTQGFFHYLLERDLFSAASQELGKLRTFLLTIFQRYIGDVRGRELAQKRGGGRELLSLDIGYAEIRYEAEPRDVATPEAHFDRSWAMSVLHAALHELGENERASGRGEQFAAVEAFLSPAAVAEGNYEAAAAMLGMNGEAVRKLVSRLRAKFRDCLRRQIAATLHEATVEQVDEELMALKAALRG